MWKSFSYETAVQVVSVLLAGINCLHAESSPMYPGWNAQSGKAIHSYPIKSQDLPGLVETHGTTWECQFSSVTDGRK